MTRRLLIVDDHTIFRQGLKGLLALHADLQVVAEASGYSSALECIAQHQLDIVIVDLSMPGRDGIELINQIRILKPALPILVAGLSALAPQRCRRFSSTLERDLATDLHKFTRILPESFGIMS